MVFATWILIALAASAIGSMTVVVDKILITKYSKDWIYLTAFFGVINFLPALVLLFFIDLFVPAIYLGLIAGILFRMASFFYMKSISLEEASRVVPLFLTSVVFVLIMESIFLDEQLLLHHYAGMIAVVFGSFIIMTRSVKSLLKISNAFYFMIMSSFVFAISEIVLKIAYARSDFLSIIFWAFTGSMLASIPILLFKLKKHHKLFYNKHKLHHILISQLLVFTVALSIYWYALSLGPVSLVTTLGGIDGLFVFIFAIVLTKFSPTILKEVIDRKTLLTKTFAISFIIVGIVLINGGL